MDRHNREREMASVLLSKLRESGTISYEQFSLGFQKLLASADDITLDAPDASRLLTLFLSRAIVDEVLPPCFLDAESSRSVGDMGSMILRAAKSLVRAKHAGERLAGCWHVQLSNQISETLSLQIRNLIQEYTASQNFEEVLQCLHEIAMPHYHHEVIYQGTLRILEDPKAESSIIEMLSKLFVAGEISSTQAKIGFQRLLHDADDLQLDYVGAKDTILRFDNLFTSMGMTTAD